MIYHVLDYEDDIKVLRCKCWCKRINDAKIVNFWLNVTCGGMKYSLFKDIYFK